MCLHPRRWYVDQFYHPPQHHSINSPTPTFYPHVRPRSCVHLIKFPQTSPAVGISFCLIIVRLGQILPETRDETRQLSESVRPPVSRPSAPDQVAISFTQVKIQRDVYVSETEDLPMGTLNRDSSGDPLKIPPSPSPPV